MNSWTLTSCCRLSKSAIAFDALLFLSVNTSAIVTSSSVTVRSDPTRYFSALLDFIRRCQWLLRISSKIFPSRFVDCDCPTGLLRQIGLLSTASGTSCSAPDTHSEDLVLVWFLLHLLINSRHITALEQVSTVPSSYFVPPSGLPWSYCSQIH